jgi:hypothetical protein
MGLFSLICLTNTVVRFIEISEFDREQFSLCQNKDRRDKNELALQESIKSFTLVSHNDVEILRCQKPDGEHLLIALSQKFVFDFMNGVMIATAGLNLYAVFDFLSFQETLQDIGSVNSLEITFALQANARLPLIVLATGQVIYLLCFYLLKILPKIQNDHIIYTCFVLICVSWIVLIFAERNDLTLRLSYIIMA